MDTRTVTINSITNLHVAKQNYLANLDPFVLTFQQSGSNPDLNYKVYRYIGPYPADATIDPVVDVPEQFKLIATLAPSATTYSDSMNDLNLNGYVLSNGNWFDGLGNNILEQIFFTKRAIYYKVVAENNSSVNFNDTPFLFIGHGKETPAAGDTCKLECRSTIRQVKYNKFLDEGDTLWIKTLSDTIGTGYAIRSISVDQNYIDRQYTVWVACTNLTNSKILRVDVRTGNIVNTYDIPFQVYSVRVDPSEANNGDCIVTGKYTQLVRCKVGTDNVIQYFGTTPAAGVYGGYTTTLVLTSNDILNSYSVWDRHYVIESPVTNPGTSLTYPTSNYGGYLSTQMNPQGITNGGDGKVFVNGRILTKTNWTEKVASTITTTTPVYDCAPAPGRNLGSCASRNHTEAGAYWTRPTSVFFGYPPEIGAGCEWVGCPANYETGWTTKTVKSTTYTTVPKSATFFADYGYLYLVTTGLTVSSVNFTNCTRSHSNLSAPYASHTGGWPCHLPVADHIERTSPDPNILGSTFFGIKADIPVSSLTATNYKIWQSMDSERSMAAISYTGTYVTTALQFSFGNAGTDNGEVVVDSQNCIYGIARLNTNHIKLYPLANNNTFPTGGTCVWPISSGFLSNGQNFYNDPYVEYVLTRDPSIMAGAQLTTYTAISTSQFDDLKRSLARTWVTTYGESVAGTYVYPKYVTGGSTANGYVSATITRVEASESFHPCSDETGIGYMLSKGKYYSRPAFIHPEYTIPTVDLIITPVNSTPSLDDTGFWNNQVQSSTSLGASGYDDLSVSYSVSTTNDHTFELQSYDFDTGDRIKDICGDIKCVCSDVYPQCGNNNKHITDIDVNNTSYKYHDPSKSGKPGVRWNGHPGEAPGTYSSDATAFCPPNPYLVSGTDAYAGQDFPIFTPSKTITVWERWPTARFYINPVNLNAMRDNWFNTTVWTRHDNPGSIDNGLSVYDENRVCSGLAPLSADITDISIGRTWPISSWKLDLKSDETEYAAFFHVLMASPYFYDTNYPPIDEVRVGNTITYTTSTANVTSNDPDFHHRDSTTEIHNNFAKHVYFHPGTYNLTLYNEASNTATQSAPICAGVTDVDTLCSLSRYATRTLIVTEACPWANFVTTSAVTVPSDYTDEYGTVVANPICAAYINPYSHGVFISGYAPNLTVTWMDSSVARSYPLCAYDWNFGDYYDELHTLSSVYVTQLNTGYPTWFSDKTRHYVTHTYAMPGIYNVSLDLRVSGTGTGACEVCSKLLHVYVEEIPLQPCFTYSSDPTGNYGIIPITGMVAPATVYVNPSCIVPGSFPICRIDWDFGDGSDIFTVSRNMSSISDIPLTAYPTDQYDPRNYITTHVYDRKTSDDQDTFTISMTAYSCNTNSHAVTAHVGALSALELPPYSNVISDDMPLHLVSNRNFGTDNNTMLVFEGRKGYTLNYVLSTG